ncbi:MULTISPECIES: hypothetical protein [Polaromonas]|uniref:Uncharacterized protein n=1 Tax=Polaromonas aquatica TaxID=332657 RepID=A0ABW1TTV1_9BURK
MTTTSERKPTFDEAVGIAWWNCLSEASRVEWAATAGTGVVADAWAAFKSANRKIIQEASVEKAKLPEAIQVAQIEAMKIMTEAKKMLEQTGLEVSLITRCPNGSQWPVLMLEVGVAYADIEKVRKGER